MKEILQFFRKLFKSLTRTKSQKKKDLKNKGKGVGTHDPSDPNLCYLSVSEDESDCEGDFPSSLGTETGTGVGKATSKAKEAMVEIEDNSQPPRVIEVAARETIDLHVDAHSSPAMKRKGPKMHPALLELYTMTDNVLGVGTFATVKEIKLKSTGKSYALKIILKSKLLGKGRSFYVFIFVNVHLNLLTGFSLVCSLRQGRNAGDRDQCSFPCTASQLRLALGDV